MVVPWRARTFVQRPRALRAWRPQLKRGPLGSATRPVLMEEFSARVADQRPLLRWAVLILDLMAAAGLLVIVLTTILHAPSPEELAKMDPEAGVLPYLTTIISCADRSTLRDSRRRTLATLRLAVDGSVGSDHSRRDSRGHICQRARPLIQASSAALPNKRLKLAARVD